MHRVPNWTSGAVGVLGSWLQLSLQRRAMSDDSRRWFVGEANDITVRREPLLFLGLIPHPLLGLLHTDTTLRGL